MAKIDITSKKSRTILAIAIIIIVPIIFHQVMGVIGGAMQKKAMKVPAVVQTISPEKMEIYSESQSAGRIDAKYSVDVIARINGWLQKRFFDEGAKIEKGQTLFKIEPDEYQIAVDNASASVRRSQAALLNAEKELKRAQELVKKDYVSKSYYDDALSARDQNRAQLDSAKAQLANAKLNLSYTNITSPIDGKIGKIMITEGNLVNTQSGPLAKIVSIKPIYVYFTLKSSEFLKFKQLGKTADLSNMKVTIQLADGNIYGEEGKIEFVDNTVNETTGTISLRATFENADELLVPGDFVKVNVKSETPQKVLLIPQSAVLDDSNGYYVWVVKSANMQNPNSKSKENGIIEKLSAKLPKKENKSDKKAENYVVEKRLIKVSDEIDKKWIVEEGLTPKDVVVGKGIQSIRYEGQPIKPVPLNETENKK